MLLWLKAQAFNIFQITHSSLEAWNHKFIRGNPARISGFGRHLVDPQLNSVKLAQCSASQPESNQPFCPEWPRFHAVVDPDCFLLRTYTATSEIMAAYFGFGALMNTVSVRMRNIHPQSSCAAKLSGFRLVFGGSHGMATVLPSPGDVVHGVLHMVTEEEKLRLDNTESSYEELKTQVETGALVAVLPTNPYSSTKFARVCFLRVGE